MRWDGKKWERRKRRERDEHQIGKRWEGWVGENNGTRDILDFRLETPSKTITLSFNLVGHRLNREPPHTRRERPSHITAKPSHLPS